MIGLLKNNWTIGLSFGLKAALIIGITFGITSAFLYGLLAFIQHCILRFFLWYVEKNIPWNYAKFLDHAVKQRFIQRVGGRYRFMHDLLRKHFADMP